jgi:hypothetical protein
MQRIPAWPTGIASQFLRRAARSTASGSPMKPRALEDGAGQRASVVSPRARIARQGEKATRASHNYRAAA